ncbi:MAG: hypothetical protein L6Q40_11050, partial [Azonexus sp.]|nr:hypothetical protein [Azonexus sp.]
MLEQLVCLSSEKWLGATSHFELIKQLSIRVKNPPCGSCKQTMSSPTTPSSVRLSDLVHPVVAGLISVI